MCDLDHFIDKILHSKLPQDLEVKAICQKATEILVDEGVIQNVKAPVTICGDIHGQFCDLLNLFKICGNCPKTNFIFLGDYVDRGEYSVETILLLISLKVQYPKSITLIRGNHESRQISQVYGFYDECIRKYGSTNVWKYCTEIFDYFTISALVEERVFCVHGGLSPSILTLDQIRKIHKQQDVTLSGAMSDILWSDPEEIEGWRFSPRGAGYLFGADICESFCHRNKLELVVRAHQLILEGFRWMFENHLVTIWSAPNYCYRCGNVASVLEIDETLNLKFKVFEAKLQDLKVSETENSFSTYFC
jgi:serine/threonine-protein phosphatase 4 catalytic subunit